MLPLSSSSATYGDTLRIIHDSVVANSICIGGSAPCHLETDPLPHKVYTRTHVHILVCRCAQIHRYTHTCTYMHTHTHIHTSTHIHIRTHTCIYTSTRTHTYTHTLFPSSSGKYPHTLMASPTICGPRNSPCIISLMVSPGVAPASIPIPGAHSRAAAASTHSLFPATYPPHGAMVPPGFLIKLPAMRSAPWVVGTGGGDVIIRDKCVEYRCLQQVTCDMMLYVVNGFCIRLMRYIHDVYFLISSILYSIHTALDSNI